MPSDNSCQRLLSSITVDNKISYESRMYELHEKVNYISLYPDTEQSLNDSKLTINLTHNIPYVVMEKALEQNILKPEIVYNLDRYDLIPQMVLRSCCFNTIVRVGQKIGKCY